MFVFVYVDTEAMENTMSEFNLISDLHKDARGYRPSASFITAFTADSQADQQEVWDSLCLELSTREAHDARQEINSQRVFETRIAGMVADYNIDRATAFRWDMAAFDIDVFDGDLEAVVTAGFPVEQEIEFYLYQQGIACKMYPMYVAEITAN
jgi:hypothetical protein